jgi:hypothetical protein
MLKSLRRWEPEVRTDVLSAIAEEWLPRPFERDELPYAGADQDLVAQVEREIRSKLALGLDDTSAEASSRILGVISDELSDAALAGVNEESLRASAGQAGVLGLDLFTIKFPQSFTDPDMDRGVSATMAERAIRRPSAVEHLETGSRGVISRAAYSLFAQHVHPKDGDAYTVLVLTRRAGYELSVQETYRLYRADVPIAPAARPLAILERFLARYGLEVGIGGQVGLLLRSQRLPAFKMADKAGWGIRVRHGVPRPSHHVTVIASDAYGQPPMVDISLAYAVNDDRYREDLRHHGVRFRG